MRAYRAGLLEDAHDAHLAWSCVESDGVGMDVFYKPPRLPIADEIDKANRRVDVKPPETEGESSPEAPAS